MTHKKNDTIPNQIMYKKKQKNIFSKDEKKGGTG